MTVLEGRLEVTLNGEKILLKPGDPALIIKPRCIHSMKGFKGERLVFREQVDPPGLYKAL